MSKPPDLRAERKLDGYLVAMSKQLLLLELNEVNFESVAYYGSRGKLPELQQLIERHGWHTTTSEQRYEYIEPWIQWVTAHTGLTLAEHGVLRLGDIVTKDLPQIWEMLEARGLKVGAVSPMNAKHRLRRPAFFVPDPWTPTEVTGPKILKSLHRAVAQAVNDNAQARLSVASLGALVSGMMRYARITNYSKYASLALGSASAPWRRALLLDLLLADVFVNQVDATQPHFASLFLNGGAHVQHHYMYSSESYRGPHRNPQWYAPRGADPVLEAYELYDRIYGTLRRRFPAARIMVATGLHQDPHGESTYYWRLKKHAEFLKKIGVEFVGVAPRMSRDFLVRCADRASAARACDRLRLATAYDGAPLFDVDNRGDDLFVMLIYPREIGDDFVFRVGSDEYSDLHRDVAFVALKNGEHNGTGYFLDTGAPKDSLPTEFPLSEIPERVMNALELGKTLHDAAA
ncbi:MAG: hypothetical protein ACREV5_04675 [Steroidobacter sp.]